MLGPDVKVLQEEVTELTIRPGATQEIDTVALASGPTFPSCAALVVGLSWQVRDPYPPASIDVQIFQTVMGLRELVASGPTGQAEVGCALLEFVNNSSVPITLELRYVVGALTGP